MAVAAEGVARARVSDHRDFVNALRACLGKDPLYEEVPTVCPSGLHATQESRAKWCNCMSGRMLTHREELTPQGRRFAPGV